MDAKTWAFLRAYILNYVVGILWLTALATLLLTHAAIAGICSEVKTISTSLSPLELTDFAAGVITVIAGIVVPYCLAILLTPTSQVVTGTLFLLQNIVWRRNRDLDIELSHDANRTWRARLGRSHDMSDRTKIMLVRSRSAETAEDLAGHLDELVFRSDVLLPTSLFLYAILWRIGVAAAIAIVAAVGMFIVGSIAVNGNAGTWRRRLNVAVVALTSDSASAYDHGASAVDHSRFKDPAGGIWLQHE